MKLTIRNKLLLAFAAVLVIVIGVSVFSYKTQSDNQSRSAWVSHTNTVMAQDDQVLLGLVNMETGFRGYLLSGKDAFLDPYTSGKQQYQAALTDLMKLTSDNPAQIARWTEISKQSQAWITEWTEKGIALRRDVNAGKTPVQQALDYEASGGGKQYMDAIRAKLSEAKQAEKDLLVIREAESVAATSLGYMVILWGTIFAVVVGLAIAFFLANSISNAAKIMVKAADFISQTDLPSLESVATAIADGDLTQSVSVQSQNITYTSQDEMGDLARAFNVMINRMQSVGSSFAEMTTNLSSLIGQVGDNADNLKNASGDLSEAASQAAQATSQITTTVQQVAKGIQDQAQQISQTASSVEQMARAIDGVAKGAQEQGQAVSKATDLTNRMGNAIEQVSGNANAVTQDSARASEAARNGGRTVKETLQGMQSIKDKVNLSAQKVQEMGRRSDEIGAIVETIEDIASQTNLLALNAAIEAARAGEHGKGFAVVADEVRKLAERAASSTKEISKLVTGIQSTVAEAVKAMDEGSKEVELGVGLANQAGEALNAILEAAEAVNQQAQLASQASKEMTRASGEMVTAVDAVSAVIEENTASTEEMAAGSNEVTRAIESIASVSEENSAAIEQVSASTEEMSAQVEEVTASAQSLADMAQTLASIVAQFKLGEANVSVRSGQPASRLPAPRRPAVLAPHKRPA